MREKRRWRQLPARQRAAIITGGLGQMLLLGAALRDLRSRPGEEIRGGKPLWVALSFVNYVGPIAYFLLGRRRQPAP
jgi:Phospholipase_D-nuclease N-terminal